MYDVQRANTRFAHYENCIFFSFSFFLLFYQFDNACILLYICCMIVQSVLNICNSQSKSNFNCTHIYIYIFAYMCMNVYLRLIYLYTYIYVIFIGINRGLIFLSLFQRPPSPNKFRIYKSVANELFLFFISILLIRRKKEEEEVEEQENNKKKNFYLIFFSILI